MVGVVHDILRFVEDVHDYLFIYLLCLGVNRYITATSNNNEYIYKFVTLVLKHYLIYCTYYY